MKKVLSLLFILFLNFLAISVMALPNPWKDCNDDLKCSADVAGFNFPLKVKNFSTRAMNDMIEITFPFKNKKNTLVVLRKSQLALGVEEIGGTKDISGVYENYPVKKPIALKNGVIFNVRGSKNKFNVAEFSAETGYYTIYSKKGLKIKELEYFYKLLEEAEAPRNYEENKSSLDELMNSRRVDGIVEPVYTQDCFPRTLEKRGVTKYCFERANLGEDIFCSQSEINMIKEYYKFGQDKDPLNYPNSDGKNFCVKD